MNVHEKVVLYIKQKEMFRDLAIKFLQIYHYLEEDSSDSDIKEMAFKEMCKYDDLYGEMIDRIKEIKELYELTDFFEEEEYYE